MPDSPSGREETRTPRRPTDGTADPSIESLETVVVRYEGRPDRCTVLPRRCPEAERVTAWLSADVDALVDLEEMRCRSFDAVAPKTGGGITVAPSPQSRPGSPGRESAEPHRTALVSGPNVPA